MPASYARMVGQRLRRVRKQQRLSLHAVEARSEREFRASVLGAYERGERAISVPRLQRLAGIYGVPVDQLLPSPGGEGERDDDAAPAEEPAGKISIDLTRLEAVPDPHREMISRYLGMIQVQRQDFNGRVLTVREDDLRALACLLDTRPDQMRSRLEELGIRL